MFRKKKPSKLKIKMMMEPLHDLKMTCSVNGSKSPYSVAALPFILRRAAPFC